MRFRKTRHPLTAALGVATALGLGACTNAFTTDVDVDLPASERELVIEATVRPGDSSRVYISRTLGILESFEYVNVAGAEVTLAVDGRAVATFKERLVENITYGPSGERGALSEYSARVPDALFVPGAVFELKVVSPRGERAVARQTVVTPGQVRSVSVTGRDYGTAITFTIDDGVGESGYLVEANSTSYYPQYDTLYQPTGQFDSTTSRMYLYTGEDIDYVGYDLRFTATDAGFANASSTFRLNANSQSSYCGGSGCPDAPRDKVEVVLRTVSREAVEYYQALQQLYDTEGNPFVEPIVLPRGFEGGRGMLILEGGRSAVEVEVGG